MRGSSQRAALLLVVVFECMVLVMAPRGLLVTSDAMERSPWSMVLNLPRTPAGSSTVAAAATAAAMAAGAVMVAHAGTPDVPPSLKSEAGSSTSGKHSKGVIGVPAGPALELDECGSASGSESEPEDYEKDYESEPDAGPCEAGSSSSSGKLWSKDQFPEGTAGHANWDMSNLTAAQEWPCPCHDRHSCIGSDRLQITELYDYRRQFRTTAHKHNGMRDASRKDLEAHYDRPTQTFTRSFVVGRLGDCCAASAGLAKGLSFDVFAKSRADTTKAKPWHAGRCQLKAKVETVERAHLEAYIRDMRKQMEGPKGGSAPKDKWHLPKKPASKRWEDYRQCRLRAKLPIIGSQSLFEKIWRRHDEIDEYGAKGHPNCDRCGELQVDREKYEGRPDKLQDVEKKQVWRGLG